MLPRKTGARVTRLRFVLEYFCPESNCRYADRWRALQQRLSVKVATLLGVPLTEVNSELMYWLQTPESPAASAKLNKLLISRVGESDFPGARARQLLESGYKVFIAFRIASTRIFPKEHGVHLFEQGLPQDIFKLVGLQADISNVQVTAVSKPEEGVPSDEFAPAFQFAGLEPDKLARGTVVLRRQPECLDRCYSVNEWVNALGPGLCSEDCECNGQRWCSHFGICAGNTPSCDTPFLSDDDLTCIVGPVPTTATRTVTSTSTTTVSTVTSSTTQRFKNLSAPSTVLDLPGSCGEAVLDNVGPCALSEDGCSGTACAVLRAAANEAAHACKEAVCATALDSNSRFVWWEKQCSEARALDAFRGARFANCADITTTSPSTSGYPRTGEDSADDMEMLVLCLVVVAAFLACVASVWLLVRMHACMRCSALGYLCCRACCRCCPKHVRNRIGKKLTHGTSQVWPSSSPKGASPDKHWSAGARSPYQASAAGRILHAQKHMGKQNQAQGQLVFVKPAAPRTI